MGGCTRVPPTRSRPGERVAEFLWCGCSCHNAAKVDAVEARDEMRFSDAFMFTQQSRRFIGASPRDVVEAAVACPTCLALHCPALLEKRIWWDDPPDPGPTPAEFASSED